MRGGGDRRSIDEDPTVRVEPVGLGLMCDYNIIVGRGGIAGDVEASNGAIVSLDRSAYAMFMMMSRRRKTEEVLVG